MLKVLYCKIRVKIHTLSLNLIVPKISSPFLEMAMKQVYSSKWNGKEDNDTGKAENGCYEFWMSFNL